MSKKKTYSVYVRDSAGKCVLVEKVNGRTGAEGRALTHLISGTCRAASEGKRRGDGLVARFVRVDSVDIYEDFNDD